MLHEFTRCGERAVRRIERDVQEKRCVASCLLLYELDRCISKHRRGILIGV